MPAPAAHLELMREGDAFFLARLAAVDDAALAEPCLLPGWSRSHLVGHMARNADALCNLFAWARTGVETPMYPSAEARAAGIEEAAQQAPDALRADVAAASARLLDAAAGLPSSAWDAAVRTARGRPITAADVPWMRIRESWVHAVDLGTGASFGDVPSAVVHELIDEVAGGLAGRDDCPAVVVRSDDRAWRIGPEGGAVEVTGDAAAVLAWLIGRPGGESLGAPAVPAWL